MSDFDASSRSLTDRLCDGLERVAAALRSDQWTASNKNGLNPTQAHVLSLLARRGAGETRVKDIAAHLGVSQPTATDSVAALERKALVKKNISSGDARAVSLHLTEQGRSVMNAVEKAASSTQSALTNLSRTEQTELLLLLTKLIRSLQLTGAIPVQRMCVTCRHFRPNFYSDADRPHHCAFVNAAFGDRNLRLDCSDHKPADPAAQTASWTAPDLGPATLRAPNPN